MTELIKKIDDRIEKYTDEMIELQRKLTAIPALCPTSDGQGELEKGKMLEEFLRSSGFSDIEYFNAPDDRVESGIRPNIVLTVKGKNPGKTVWILSHLDIVPPGDLEKWDSDPYEMKIDRELGIITGRGVEDNQQGLVSSIFALKAIVDSGYELDHDVKLLFVADEETGSKYGLIWLLDNHPELFSKDDIVLVPDFGSPDSTEIEIAEKSLLWAKFSILGKQAHASRPHTGNNAHRAGAHMLIRLDRELHKNFDARDDLFNPPVSTFEPTKKEENVPNFNTIPPEDIFCFDCRILPQYQIDDVKKLIEGVMKSIEGQFKVEVNVEYAQCEQAAPATSEDAEIVKRLIKGIREVYGTEGKPIGIGGGTVAAGFRHIGIPAAVWSTLNESAHQSNEFCKISNMVNDARVMARIILN